ncbi:hypothetical protein NM688_g7438 [Phlebia brevispora]|uniref:Uncharacterized protein n=1 Tax=Phlebia brevispora TaxID=194682 RepID=A0ACC1S547_9APHY|nr:hypothetical protein NM688_g7438 [Phlebia brevispora]
MSGAPPLSDPAYVRTAEHLMAAKMYSLAACVMLFYDTALTFGDEVEKIWQRPFTGATVLWFLSVGIHSLERELRRSIDFSAYNQQWPESVCNRFVLFPEALKTVIIAVIGVIFILRLYAIYSRSRLILGVFSALLCAELGVKIWAFTDGVSVKLPPGLISCILTGKTPNRYVWTFVVELIFDTCVFFATIVKTLKIHRASSPSHNMLIRIMLRDGILYFAVIFGANLITVIFFLTATVSNTFGRVWMLCATMTSLLAARHQADQC